MNKQEALDVIFNERGLEFAYELHRWIDLMRFDKGAEILGEKGWTEKYRYMPISQMDLDEEGNIYVAVRKKHPDTESGMEQIISIFT